MAQATYSPEDNKLRLYTHKGELSTEEVSRIKAAGFKWAPKQELWVAPSWSPSREDILIELCGEIDDEGYSAAERSADRAERFSGYRDKRRAEAGALADRFDAGPAAFGHQSQRRAERQAARHDRLRSGACSQWAKAEYWQQRTAGVIRSALYKQRPEVRRSRIKKLEAEQRKYAANLEAYAVRYAAWQKVATLEGADAAPVMADRYTVDREKTTPAALFAYRLANDAHEWSKYTHPRTGAEGSIYDHLTNAADPITAAEAARLWLENRQAPGAEDSHPQRWSRHYDLRLTYERAMLANEGGAASNVEMEAGGWIGSHQIERVNRSPATGKVVSVMVRGPHPWRRNADGTRKIGLNKYNIERLPEGAYRPPTDEERAAFAKETTERKKAEKASKPKAPSLINPTDEDAERLQQLWNAKAKEKFDEAVKTGRAYGNFEPSEVWKMTQAEYSARSKGSYATVETRTLHADGRLARRFFNMWTSEGEAYDASLPEAACKIRMKQLYDFGRKADRVIVLTDKPQKPLPLKWEAIEANAKPIAEEIEEPTATPEPEAIEPETIEPEAAPRTAQPALF